MASTGNVLPEGTILDSGERKYRIVGVLGKGGFGITYLAMGELTVGNVTTEGKFAIKEHYPEDFCYRDGDFVNVKDDKIHEFSRSKSDFIAEAKKLHVLGQKNDNIVKVNEVFEANGTAYYVMQYINGSSLADRVGKKGPFIYSKALAVLLPIFDAVEFLHNSRINHLDIKPDNIMLNETNEGIVPMLIDFGLSVHFKKNGDKTSPKGVQGVSEGYSPLEQYAGITEFNAATDIYSLMATLLFALTGETPKAASNLKKEDIRKAIAGKVPEDKHEAFFHAMKKDVEDRTESIGQLKGELGFGGGKGKSTVIIGGDDALPNRNKWFLWGGIGIFIIAAAIVLPLTLGKGGKKKVDLPVIDTVLADTLKTDSPMITQLQPVQPVEPVKPTEQEPAEQPSQTPVQNGAQHIQPVQPAHIETPAPAVTSGTLSLGYGTWTGGIKNGKPDGKGTLRFSSSHNIGGTTANAGDYMTGTYDNGKLSYGKLYDSSGNLIQTIIP